MEHPTAWGGNSGDREKKGQRNLRLIGKHPSFIRGNDESLSKDLSLRNTVLPSGSSHVFVCLFAYCVVAQKIRDSHLIIILKSFQDLAQFLVKLASKNKYLTTEACPCPACCASPPEGLGMHSL